MCGIVVYYGDAENPLARVLSGMWAIIYRAPDSTGVGLVGSEIEPLKIRRELGSVYNLVDRLVDTPVFDDTELRVVSILDDGSPELIDFIRDNQNKLLAFEGFNIQAPISKGDDSSPYLNWETLIDSRHILEMEPGTPGAPDLQEHIRIDSANSFRSAIKRMTFNFDLPLVVVEKLFEKALEQQIQIHIQDSVLPVSSIELLQEFRQLFDSYAHDEIPSQPRRKSSQVDLKNPYARKYLWKCLKSLVLIVPSDFTKDGVANLFRRIDSAVLAGEPRTQTFDDMIQVIFENFWCLNKNTPPVGWRTLYRTERLYNVYGLAAASVLAFFQTTVYMKTMIENASENGLPPGHIPGRTHPCLLKFMAMPVIAQGRWAIQSSISVRNAHPFLDENKIRAVVLNGQFHSQTESRVKEYLIQVAGIRPRSDNSTELFSLLWGYYFDTAYMASQRYETIERQHRLDLEDISICSQSIDWSIFKSLKNKTKHDIDEMSFIRAMEVMLMSGGQFAVSGISLISKDRILLGVHKRPVYIVRRLDTADFMIVSDINAAIGLFPQSLAQSASIKLRKLLTEYSKKSVIVEPAVFSGQTESENEWFRQAKMDILKPFQVEIYALDQERIFATVQTVTAGQSVLRTLEIKDFSGEIRTDIHPEVTYLTPLTFYKDFGKTFYEEHLLETPGLMQELISRYTDPATGLPVFDIRTRLLTRRFGNRLASLNRMILVSTGFSYELSNIVEKNMERFFPDINIMVTSPLDMDHVESSINPDRDLVVMVSWSGTTSDMIDFASHLISRNILMVGITEKPFSDMGLVLKKSVGVIPVFSGEEATVVPLKSAICMLLVLDLFCLYILNATRNSNKTIVKLIKELSMIPQKLSDMLTDDHILEFCRETASQTMKSNRHYIIDSLHYTGSGKLGVLNLELNAWTSMGTAIDYSEQDAFVNTPVDPSSFVMVNATCREQLKDAVTFIQKLKEAGRAFFAVTYKNKERKEIQASARQTALLPKVQDYFQPFIDLPFMFLFGFYLGLANGRISGQMPRNLAKSVTAGRAKDSAARQASDLVKDLKEKNRCVPTLPAKLTSLNTPLSWVEESTSTIETTFYKDLVRLSALFHETDTFSAIFKSFDHEKIQALAEHIFKYLADDGMIVFVPLDKHAESGCRNFIRIWSLLFSLPLLVEYPEKFKGGQTTDRLVVAVASQPAAPELVAQITADSPSHALIWLGPEYNKGITRPFEQSFGAYYIKDTLLHCPNELIYMALCQFFAAILSKHNPEHASALTDQFKLFLPAVISILNDQTLKRSLKLAMDENYLYKKTLFITSFKGNSIAWEYKFKPHIRRSLESETFGTSTYSRLVLVDPEYPSKYIRLRPRSQMAVDYDQEMLLQLEKRYLGGISIDDFLDQYALPLEPDTVMPFLIDEHWFLPALHPEYDTDKDCLVIIDATSETHFDAALDELATFASRYARLIVITQNAFAHDGRLSALKKYPVSHLVLLPGLPGKAGQSTAWSDFVLPVIMNIIGSAIKFMDDQTTDRSNC
ncbi:MAG: hypothetical protein D3926_24495 [Desulfobacteraceae bacterium]|nr:MAG: hypothetical protein D3926_24495 [Desulfobacteraceae bacterium]